MIYYKRDNGAIYEAREDAILTSDICVEISEREYISAVAGINASILANINTETQGGVSRE